MTEVLTFDALWDELAHAEDDYIAARDREERLELRYGAGSRDARVMRATLAADKAAFRCADLRRAICAKPILCASDLHVLAKLAHRNPDDFQVGRALSTAVLAFTA